MNQIFNPISYLPTVSSPSSETFNCNPPCDSRFKEIETEIERLNTTVSKLSAHIKLMQNTVDAFDLNPNDKRLLVSHLEERFDISRRHACRILNLARSTCWYRASGEPYRWGENDAPIETLSKDAVIQRLKKLSRQTANGFDQDELYLRSQFEFGLNKLGLPRVAKLASMNVNLAMEIFNTWCAQPKS